MHVHLNATWCIVFSPQMFKLHLLHWQNNGRTGVSCWIRLWLFLCVSLGLPIDSQPKKIRKPPGLPSSVRACFCSPSTHAHTLTRTIASAALLQQFCDGCQRRPSALSNSLWVNWQSGNLGPNKHHHCEGSTLKWCSWSGCHVDEQIYRVF